MKKWFVLTMLCIALTAFNSHAQVELYIAGNGNDAGLGTLRKPFKTPERAVRELAKMKGKKVTIYVRGGTYYLNQPIVLNNDNVKTKSLLIAAYNDEEVVLSAGQTLKLSWVPFKNGIYVAKVPAGMAFERLYVNGKLQPLARYPNYDSTAGVFNGTASDAISVEKVKQWKHPIGGYVHGLHEGEWGGFHYRITGVDEKGQLEMEGGWQNNRPSALHKEYRFVENIFEELDAPGEWFLDKAKARLYYLPLNGMPISKVKVEVSHFKNSITVTGSAEKPLSGIEIKGIIFLHNERSFMDTREPLLRSDWTIYRGGAILMENTENSKVTDCRFKGVGGNAIMLSGYNKNDSISGNLIQEAGASGIAFVGSADAVRSPSFRYQDYVRYDQLDKTPGPKSNNYPQQCIAENNLIHDIGQIEKQATGVEIEIAANITVRYNSIYNTPRAGINIGDGCFGGHILEYNDVFNTVLETGDHGAFNSWGRDRFWSSSRKYMDSLVNLHPELILLDAQQTTIIRNNRFRCDHGWDIDLDDGSSNYHIYNNLCLNGGLKLREGFYRTVENNITVNNSFHPHVWFKNSGDVFRRNIVIISYAPIGINYWGKEIDQNFFSSKASLEKAQENNTDQNSISGNPLFINPSKGDYRVEPQSAALKVGFKNFSMDSFGVQKPMLKKIAATPALPLLMSDEAAGKNGTSISFMGAVLKSIQGLGDRSAYGLPDESGAIIISFNENSPLKAAGLLVNDVIRTMDGTAILKAEDLKKVQQSSQWKRKTQVEVMRNQQLIKMELLLK